MSELHGDCFEAIQSMLDSYEVPELTPTEDPTILEIAGFPHGENVCSNILAFFLDTRQVHGFGTLFIRSILEAHRSKCSNQGWLEGVPLPEDVGDTNAVEREVRTHDGKRIDILVDCAEVRICIENKIWSGLDNDLGHYREHCEKDGDERSFVGIVLSPNQIQSGKLDAEKFVSITYDDLFARVEKWLDNYIGSAKKQYQHLLNDFRKHYGRFWRPIEMNKNQINFLEFWKKNDKKIGKLEGLTEELRNLLREKGGAKSHVKNCRNRLSKKADDMIEGWVYQKDTAAFRLNGDRRISGCKMFLDVEFHPLRIIFYLGCYSSPRPPIEFAEEINKRFGTDFRKYDARDRVKFAIEGDPFDNKVCDDAVERTVRILEHIVKQISQVD